ncbi:MAG: hypothetical protein KAQ93_01315, partial [Spirochaetales bacterium]|nr:hypothetical protein [Spirochaetales bacterium]
MKLNIMQLFISRISRLSTSERILLSEIFSTVDGLMDLQLNDLEQILRRKLIGMIYNPIQIRDEVDTILNDIHDS